MKITKLISQIANYTEAVVPCLSDTEHACAYRCYDSGLVVDSYNVRPVYPETGIHVAWFIQAVDVNEGCFIAGYWHLTDFEIALGKWEMHDPVWFVVKAKPVKIGIKSMIVVFVRSEKFEICDPVMIVLLVGV